MSQELDTEENSRAWELTVGKRHLAVTSLQLRRAAVRRELHTEHM